MNKNFIKYSLIIISTLLSLIVIELFLYIDHYSDVYYKKFFYKINNIEYAFNDNPKDYFNDKNQEKIIFIGDSYTVGLTCAAKKKDFVNVVKSLSNTNCIYNFGVGGNGPADYLNIYNHFKQKNLKRVIVVLNYNDIAIDLNDCLTFQELSKNGYPKIKMCDYILEKKIDRYNDTALKRIENILEHTRIWRLIRNKLANIPFLHKYYGRAIIPVLYQNQQSEQFITYLDILSYLHTDAKKNEIMIDFVYYPDVYYLKDVTLKKNWQSLIDVAKTKNIMIDDAWDYIMENKYSDNMSWSLIDTHPSCEAHEIMANYIVEKIL